MYSVVKISEGSELEKPQSRGRTEPELEGGKDLDREGVRLESQSESKFPMFIDSALGDLRGCRASPEFGICRRRESIFHFIAPYGFSEVQRIQTDGDGVVIGG